MNTSKLEIPLDQIMGGSKSPWGKLVAILLAWSLAFMAWNVVAIDCAFAAEGGSSEKAAGVDAAKKAEKEAAEKAAAKAAEEREAKEREAAEKAAKEREAAEKAAKEREAAEKAAEKAAQDEKKSAVGEEGADAGRGDAASPEGSAESQGVNGNSGESAAQSHGSASKEAAAKSKSVEKSGKSADKTRKSDKRDGKADESTESEKKREERSDKGSEKKKVAYPAAVFGGGASGISVSVHAPSGALPKGTKLVVSGASAGLSRGDVCSGSADVVVIAKAVAISFKDKDGKGVSPKKPVRIGLSGVFAESGQELHAIDLEKGSDVAGASSGAGSVFFESARPSSYALVVTKPLKTEDERARKAEPGAAERVESKTSGDTADGGDVESSLDAKNAVQAEKAEQAEPAEADMPAFGVTARFSGINGVSLGLLGTSDASLSITASDGGGVYNGKPFGLDNVTASVDSAIIEYKVGSGDWSTEVPTVTNAADSQDKTISVRASAIGYKPVQVNGLSIVVKRKAVTVAANSLTKTRGTRDPKLTASLSGLVGSDKIAYDLTRDPGEDVGAYEITASGKAEQDNYDVNYKPGTLTIAQASGRMKVAEIADVTYSGRAQTPAVDVADAETGSILAAGKDYSVTYSDNVNAGEGAATVKGAGNYEGDEVTSTFVIKPAPLAVVTASATKPYDGKPLTAPGRLKGLVNKEEATFKTTGSQKRMGKSKNTYKIVWDKTAAKSNYTVVAEQLGKLIVRSPLPSIISGKTSSHTLGSPGIPSTVAMPSFRDLSVPRKVLPDVPDVTASDYVPEANDKPTGGALANTTSAFAGAATTGGWSLFDAIVLVVSLVAAAVAFVSMARSRSRQEQAALAAGQQRVGGGKAGIACIVLGVIAAALFVATQNLSLPMVLFDVWSVPFGIIGVTCVVLALLGRGNAHNATPNGGGTVTAA